MRTVVTDRPVTGSSSAKNASDGTVYSTFVSPPIQGTLTR